MDSPEQFSLMDPEIQKCPFAANNLLREKAPVYRDPATGYYVITRYQDVRRISLDYKTYSSETRTLAANRVTSAPELIACIFREEGWEPLDTLVTSDPPSHKRYRSLVDSAFSFARVRRMEPYIQRIVDELIDDFIDDGATDFVPAFSVPLPLTVIADQLGVSRDELDILKNFSDRLMEGAGPHSSTEAEIAYAKLATSFQRYFAAKIEAFREHPADCMLSDLVHVEIEGQRLNMPELLSLVQILLIGGNESTTNAIGSGLRLLIETPEIAQRLTQDPSATPDFVEETLRLCAPIQGMPRRVTADVEIEGVKIPAGSIVFLRYGAANWDPAKFTQPDKIDLDRPNAKLHLAFGIGIHVCIGNQLVRSEMQIAFDTILRRLGKIRFAGSADSVAFGTNFIAYGPSKLRIAFERR